MLRNTYTLLHFLQGVMINDNLQLPYPELYHLFDKFEDIITIEYNSYSFEFDEDEMDYKPMVYFDDIHKHHVFNLVESCIEQLSDDEINEICKIADVIYE